MAVPAYLDIGRLCEELSISERTADAWVRQGILPAPRARGGKRLWKWTEVESYLDDGGPNMAASADPEAERIKRDMERVLSETSRNGK
jgi:predicted site-specific integrase-resolvase